MTSMTVERDLALPMLGGVQVIAYLYRPTADSAAFGVVWLREESLAGGLSANKKLRVCLR